MSTQVASILISPDTVDPDGMGPMVAPTGVAVMADLYSSATNPVGPNFDDEAAVTLNHIATLPGVDVRAINMSFQNGRISGNLNDGNQLLTQFVDWSAAAHDLLYVAAGKNSTSPAGNSIPTDNFNGMTIARSTLEGTVYRRVSAGNDFSQDAEGDRTSISLIAPGDGVDATGLSNVVSTVNGASFAAPHVTATVALLQQHANERISSGAIGWDAVRSRRHETMKAVLLNSADKFNDDESVTVPGQGTPVPQGSLLGMSRTVLKRPQPGIPNPDWFNSFAWDDSPEGGGHAVPLDEEMGAGHLNARRARTQFAAGEFDSDGSDIPTIGWDYGATTGEDDINRYRFAGELLGGSFISITLAWDRLVEFATDTGTTGQYDSGDTFQEYVDDFINPPDDSVISDLDILLLPKFAASDAATIALSDSAVGTVEHLFFQIPETGEYEFWIRQHDEEGGVTQNYAVAWWALSSIPFMPPGDYNGDMIVDAEDYDEWSANFGEALVQEPVRTAMAMASSMPPITLSGVSI
jgi:hypothetical protein